MSSFFNRLRRNPARPALSGPIVVGGVGGSGTRLLAEALQGLDVYIGDSLNRALDNLWYTLLLRRAELFPEAGGGTAREIEQSMEVFRIAMTEGLNDAPTRWQRHLIQRALEQSLPVSKDQPRKARKSLITSTAPEPGRYRAWGWKEPNTHVHLEALARAFPTMKYVLLIRHGLDMAFSRNQVQLHRWGAAYGVTVPGEASGMPGASLRYWVRANRKAMDQGERLLGDRFLVLRYDDLCRDPGTHMRRFLDFVGLEAAPDMRERLTALPRPPESMGRYRQQDCSCFAAADLEAVREMGFQVELD